MVEAICDGNKVNELELYCINMNLHKRGKLNADATDEILICVMLGINPA
jgi:hypothetical protein